MRKFLFWALLCGTFPLYAAMQDPTRPPWYTGPLPSYLSANATISEIVIGETRRFAVVDGQFVVEGDTVRGAEVVRIDHNEITFKKGDQRFTVPMITPVLQSATRE